MTQNIIAKTALALAFAILPAAAHDFVLTAHTDSDGKITVSGLYGHPGAWEAPDIRRLIALDLHAPDTTEPTSILDGVSVAKSSALKLQAAAGKLGASGDLTISAVYDNGYWVSAEGGKYYSTTKQEASGRIEIEKSSHNIKFAKVLIGGNDYAIGHRLEIVLQEAPAALAADATASLPVKVLFDGKPLNAAELAIVPLDGQLDHDTPGTKTDANGIANLSVESAKTYVIRVSHDTPSEHPSLADIDSFSATLVFDTKQD